MSYLTAKGCCLTCYKWVPKIVTTCSLFVGTFRYFFRKLSQAIAMTACDLCASIKPWDIQVQTVKVIFEEFYAQVLIDLYFSNFPISVFGLIHEKIFFNYSLKSNSLIYMV